MQKDTFFSEEPFAIVALSKMPLDPQLELHNVSKELVHTVGVKVELIRQQVNEKGDNIILVEGLERVHIHHIHVNDDTISCEWTPVDTLCGDEKKFNN